MGKGLSIGEMDLLRVHFNRWFYLEDEIFGPRDGSRPTTRWMDCPICGGKSCLEIGTPITPRQNRIMLARPERWYCWGDCASGGDVFDLVALRDHISREEAMRKLGERGGLWFTGEDPDPVRGRALVQSALQDAQEYLASQAEGYGELQDALRSRLASLGIDEEARARWGVGYMPDAGSLLGHLRARGYSPKTLLDSGLVDINRYHQRVTESMRRRTRGMVVTIPLRNGKGDHVGFAYRDWPDAKGWFKGTNAVWRDDCPDEDRLPRALLGIDRAREAIAGSGRAVVVRRIEDLIAMHEAGLSQAVVIVGSVPGVDRGPSDLAGHESLAWLHSAGARDIVFVGPDMRPTNWGLRLRPFHVELPEGTGVAEFLRDHGAIELRRLIDGAEQCQLPMFA